MLLDVASRSQKIGNPLSSLFCRARSLRALVAMCPFDRFIGAVGSVAACVRACRLILPSAMLSSVDEDSGEDSEVSSSVDDSWRFL